MIPTVCVGIRADFRCITPAEADEVPPFVPYVVLFPVIGAVGRSTFLRYQYNTTRNGQVAPDACAPVRIIRERHLPMGCWTWWS